MTDPAPADPSLLAEIAAKGPADWRPTHRHKKGGLYRVLGTGLHEADRVDYVIYDDETGQIWMRPAREFWDGRFTSTQRQESPDLPPAPPPAPKGLLRRILSGMQRRSPHGD